MKADRLLSMITLLTEHKLLSATRLAEMLEVSPRTIYRDVETLSMAGFPIYTTTGKYGGIGILDSYKIDKQLLNVFDIKALLLGLHSIDNIIPNQSTRSTSLKITNLIAQQHQNEIHEQQEQIKIDPSSWQKSTTLTQDFELLQAAIQNKQVIRFFYIDRMGNPTNREIEPYTLLFKSSHWYLQGFCLQKQENRLFKLERMREIELLSRTFLLRGDKEKNPELTFQDEQCIQVTLRIQEEILHRILLLYGEECILSKQENGYMIQIPLQDNAWGIQYILGLGAACECLEPVSLRQKIIQMLDQMQAQYKQ